MDNINQIGKIPIIDQSSKSIAGYWNNFADCVKINNPVIIGIQGIFLSIYHAIGIAMIEDIIKKSVAL